MNVYSRLLEARARGPLHFLLIDPDKQQPAEAARLAAAAAGAGSDAIMVGGSHATMLPLLGETVREIKKAVSLPVILFPSSHSALTPEADALFFMSLLNSRSTQYLIEEQVKGSVVVRELGLEPLPMGYVVVDGGAPTSVAFAGDVKLLPREKPEYAVSYALAAAYLGMKMVYLEAGSGAKESVPREMVAAVKEAVGGDVLVIVGGGIRDERAATEKVQAGADIIVTGTVAEEDPAALEQIIRAVKGGAQR